MAMIILDLCGGTGAWSRPYREAGCDVRVLTLPAYDILRTEFGRTFNSSSDLWFLGDGPSMCVDARDVYGILAAPPCTEFSLAKGARPRNLAKGMAVVEACLRIIWHCRHVDGLRFWALENPKGLLRQYLGKPSMTFEQWQFGDHGIKPTDLWGYYNPPHPTVTTRPDNLVCKWRDSHSHGRLMASPKCPPEYAYLNLDRAALRAITPSGFAQAFFKANR